MAEALIVWALFGLFGLLVLVTYSRVPPDELYNVSGDGLAGGASRVVVFLNYPVALVAVAILLLVTERLRKPWLALLAAVLCLVILIPGVVDQSDLDAKLVNLAPALGVLIALGLTVWAVRVAGIGGAGSSRGDRARIAIAAALTLVALPWIFAELGVYIGDVLLLRDVFRSKQLFEGHSSVHLGEHHGFQGFLLVLTALLLTRELPRMRATRLRTALAAYLSLMIAYGLGNMANDGWLEQVVKRGWTGWEIPGMIRPDMAPIWGLTILVAAAIYGLFWRRERLSG